jgi:transposase
MTAWTQRFRQWLGTLRFDHAAQAATYADYLAEVDHAVDRIHRLEQAIDAAAATAPASMQAVIAALQALRGVGPITAATIVAEVGPLARFDRPRQLMAYAGAVSREDSSGPRIRRGAITKTGNAHLRRVVIEAAWAYQHRPTIGRTLRQRQRDLSPVLTAIAWKAQHRLHDRYRRLLGRGKVKPQVVTAIGRELLGFIWAIGVEVERSGTTAATA